MSTLREQTGEKETLRSFNPNDMNSDEVIVIAFHPHVPQYYTCGILLNSHYLNVYMCCANTVRSPFILHSLCCWCMISNKTLKWMGCTSWVRAIRIERECGDTLRQMDNKRRWWRWRPFAVPSHNCALFDQTLHHMLQEYPLAYVCICIC